MPPSWLGTIAWIVIGIAMLCALIILYDIVRGHRQKMAVMNVVWPITSLYFGPLGLWAYWRMGRPSARPPDAECQQHAPGGSTGNAEAAEHDMADHGQEHKPFWQTVFVSTSHCGAGCTVGDVIGEWAIFAFSITLLGSKLVTSYIVAFALAYALGIIFQYFAIAPMRGLGVAEGLKAAIKADTLSLIAFEIGMFGWMALVRLVFFSEPPEPNSALFWFMMQIAMVIGFLTSYPANWFLVRRGVKEAM